MILSYVMPEASVGPAVWLPFVDGTPCAALITEVGDRAVSLTIFPEGSAVGIHRTGIRHVSDPDVSKLATAADGLWDFSDDRKLLLKLAEDIGVSMGPTA
jgi:hypothetical protein